MKEGFLFAKYFKFILFSFLALFLFFPKATSAAVLDESFTANIDKLTIDVAVNSDGSYNVKESFNTGYYFSGADELNWPVNTSSLKNLKVLKNGQEIKKSQYKIVRNSDLLVINGLDNKGSNNNWEFSWQEKGDVTPQQKTEKIFYQPINSLGINIIQLDMKMTLPKSIDISQIKPEVYAVHGAGASSVKIIDGKTVEFFGQDLVAFSSFAGTLEVPQNTLSLPFWKTFLALKNLAGLGAWTILSIIMPCLALLVFVIILIFKNRGENIKPWPQQIISPPSKIPPALVGLLIRQKISAREISATILDLAYRGYLVIINKAGQYVFGERRNISQSNLANFETALGSELFKNGISVSPEVIQEESKKELFSQTISQIYWDLYNIGVSYGWFKANPLMELMKYKTVGVLLFFGSAIAFFLTPFFADPPYPVFAFLGAAFVSLFIIRSANFIPMRTTKGKIELEKWLAFKDYLVQYPVKPGFNEINQDVFLNYLPYAVVWEAEREWANHFIDTPFHQPSWYTSLENSDSLPKFTQQIYPMIDNMTYIMSMLKEPVLG